jgi:hypothetical protein
LRAIAGVFLLALIAACAGTPVRNPVPDSLSDQAAAIGMTDIRFWED